MVKKKMNENHVAVNDTKGALHKEFNAYLVVAGLLIALVRLSSYCFSFVHIGLGFFSAEYVNSIFVMCAR